MKNVNAAQLQHKFAPQKVLYLTGDINYCTLYLLDGKAILSSRTLKWYFERWPNFVRIHKAHLVNPDHIYSCVLSSSTDAHLIMRNGARLTIGRRRIVDVIEQLGIDLPNKSYQSTHLLNPEWNTLVPAHVRVA
ncbi:LytTR family transcriptional regulator [Spirosoma sp. KCTC 42546]|uniref:LytR/AlgR family response regulator transcription factor n=1 Tax=Spirosoma sp. KCTC 42546 TaxID=2520506 RepID=UPI00115AB985|nr:LytTR family DNA-binding domain-containing protein [Spirosoma sp. KCTC 42546]QDK80066.1 LytTR family transcriptional regulator [Spirosoma sp. KCTC 42546]